MRPELFRIPIIDWPVFSYGFMLMIGFIVSILYASSRAKRERIDPNHVLDIGLYAVVAGILGARAMYYWEFFHKKVPVAVARVVRGEDPPYNGPYDFTQAVEVVRGGAAKVQTIYFQYLSFAERPWYTFFFVHEGGIVFYGGLLLATFAIALYIGRANRRLAAEGRPPLPALRLCDILACAVPVGLSFGRLGCTLNGCCWGRRISEGGHALLALQFPPGSPAFESHVARYGLSPEAACSYPVHATQLYEWGGALLIAAALFLIYRVHRRDGQIFALLGVFYGPLRYVIEGFREHDPGAERTHWASWLWDPIARAPMTNSQIVSIAILVAGMAGLVAASRFGPRYEPPVEHKRV
jgi:phosphatidylglycerol:prolipoprotein diacylglycerol transferase